MSSWTDLPTEIIVSIFRNLHFSEGPNRDLQQCCLTCHQWRQSSRKLLFSKITFRSKENVMNVISIFKEEPSLAKYVKILDLTKVAQLGAPIIEYFSDLFTNLEEFRFRNTDINYNNFCKVICKGGFLYLKKFPLPESATQNEWYMKFLEIKKGVVTSLKLGDDTSLSPLQDKLHEFPALNALTIVLRSRDAGCFMNYVETIYEKNKLQSIEFITIKLNVNVTRRNFLRSFDYIHPIPNVTRLRIEGIYGKIVVDDTLMRYVMKKFPNLTYLLIEENYMESDFGGAGLLGNISVSVDVAAEFFNYVSKMNTSYVECISTRERTGEILERYCSPNYKEPLFYPCLNLANPEEEDALEAGDVLNLPAVTLRGDRRGSAIRSIVVDFGRRANLVGQLLDLIERIGKYFTIVKLEETPGDIYFTALERIAKHCTRLETLDLEACPPITVEDYQNITPNQSLTKVELRQSSISTELFSYIALLFPRIETFFFTSPFHARNEPKQEYLLDFSNTSLKSLEMLLTYNVSPSNTMILNDGVCVKVCTEKKEDYLLFGCGEIVCPAGMTFQEIEFKKELTASEFKDLEEDGRHFVYNIVCKSLETLSIGYYVPRDKDYRFKKVSY